MNNPLASLKHTIDSAQYALHNEQFGTEAPDEDPLERLERRIASGRRAAQFAPPLTGLVADIEAAAHVRDHAAYIESSPEYDLVEVLAPTPKPVATPPPRAVMLTPAKPVKKSSAPPVSPPVTRPEQAAQRPSGGGVIASVLLDAIAARDLPGAARAEAARLLSQGLALGDEELMREALTTLITGS